MAKSKNWRRAPKVKNVYNLTISKIKKLKVGNRSGICEPIFWRNDVIQAWCISAVFGGKEALAACDEDSYWLGIYDEDAKAYKSKFRFYFTSYGGMCGYEFEKFFKPEDIENEMDLELQEGFLAKINELIDLGILVIPDKEEK